MTYIIPSLILGGCGIFTGILLTIASNLFYFELDERIEKIEAFLPQANCGACGFSGCADYADSIVNKGVDINLCRLGGDNTTRKIAKILNIATVEVRPMTAVVHCNGNCNATKKQFDFVGIQSCKAAKRFYSGNGMCKYGCIGLGDCNAVCNYNAINIKDGVAKVIFAHCVACGQCVTVCPNNLISIKLKNNTIDVLCLSADTGKDTKLSCSNGCIGCKICEKKCTNDAIKVENNHAVINYEKCNSCSKCKTACPVDAIQ